MTLLSKLWRGSSFSLGSCLIVRRPLSGCWRIRKFFTKPLVNAATSASPIHPNALLAIAYQLPELLLAKRFRDFTAMRKSEFVSIPKRIPHPKCANCGVQMWLSRIEPDTSNDYRRTFECLRCESVAIRIVKSRWAVTGLPLCLPLPNGG